MRFRAFFAILALAAAAQAQPAFQVRDINVSGGLGVVPPGGLGARPHQLTPTRGKLFFRVGSDFEGSIWATDGTPGGTLKLPGGCVDDDCFPDSPQLLGSLDNLAFWITPAPGRSRRSVARSTSPRTAPMARSSGRATAGPAGPRWWRTSSRHRGRAPAPTS